MTDAHCHVVRGETRHLLCEPFSPEGVGAADVVFYGTHPWYLDDFDEAALRARLAANPSAGVGEIGLDRLRERTISPRMRAVFESQLRLAAEFHRPVVLHGAKCWGEVVHTLERLFPARAGALAAPPAFLFHGFSRAGGLLADIVRLNGFVSVGPALLNDHALNYRALVKALPLDRLLLESDATREKSATVPHVTAIAAKLAELRGLAYAELERTIEENIARFL